MSKSAKKISKTVLMCLLIAVPLVSGVAQESTTARIFINSNPIHASIFINGERAPQVTPALLTVPAGDHEVEIIKDDRYTRFDFSCIADEVKVADVFLSGGHVTFEFIGAEHVYTNGKQIGGDVLFRIEDGVYQIKNFDDGVGFTPIYPRQQLVDRLDTAFPIFLGLSGLLTIGDFVRPKSAGFFPSPITLTAYAGTIVTGGFDFAFRARRKRYLEGYDLRSIAILDEEREAEDYYRQAENALRINASNEALRNYGLILSEYPDYHRLPSVLYNTARIHYINGQLGLAEKEYELLIKRYPVPQYFDQSCRFLAEIYIQQERFDEAVDVLKRMVFQEQFALFSKAEVGDLIESLEARSGGAE